MSHIVRPTSISAQVFYPDFNAPYVPPNDPNCIILDMSVHNNVAKGRRWPWERPQAVHTLTREEVFQVYRAALMHECL